MKKTILELKNVCRDYKIGNEKIKVLKNISFKIKEGDFLVILGKSGSGKTTIVNQIGCLDKPTSGTISIENKKVNNLSDDDLAKVRGKNIGYIFQKFNLIKTLSVLENVQLPLIFLGIDKKIREQKAMELLKKFGMENKKKNKPNQLSGGEQQRVAICRALINSPKIILADEPTGNLDIKTGKKVMDYLKKLNKEGITIILVTHDESLIKLSNQIIVIKDGEIESNKKI